MGIISLFEGLKTNKRHNMWVWTIIIAILCFHVLVLNAQQNIMVNGDLETAEPFYGYPVNAGDGSSVLSWTDQEAHQDFRSLEIYKPNASSAAVGWITENLAQRYWNHMTDNITYDLWGWIKTSGVNTNPTTDDERIGLLFKFYDASNTLIIEEFLPANQSVSNNDWHQVSSSAFIPEGSVPDSMVCIAQFGKDATGTAWFDDIDINSDPWSASFFGGDAETPRWWWKWTSLSLIGEAKYDNSDSHSGSYSAKLEENDTDDDEIVFYSMPVPVVSDQYYYISAWIKTQGVNTDSTFTPTGVTTDWIQDRMGICFFFHESSSDTSSWNIVPPGDFFFYIDQTIDSHDWRKYEAIWKAPVDAAGMSMRARFNQYPTGTAWFDDFSVQEVLHDSILVIFPNGGEVLYVGNDYNIAWTSTESIANVKIEYSTDGGSNWSTIETSTPNNGAYTWNVPNTVSNNCLIKVSDAVDEDPYDISSAEFTSSVLEPFATNVQAQPLLLLPGETVTISATCWDSDGLSSVLAVIESPDETVIDNLTLYDDGGHNDGAANDSLYANTWVTPGSPAFYRVDLELEDALANTRSFNNATSFSTDMSVLPQQWTTHTADDFDPSLAELPDGRFFLVYNSGQNGQEEIFYKISDDLGETWSVPESLSPGSENNRRPHALTAVDGKVWVVWERDGQIYYRTSSDNAATWSGEAQLFQLDDWNLNPRMVQTLTGRLWLVFSNSGQGDAYDVFGIYSDNNGLNWSAAQRLTDNPGNDHYANISVNTTGTLFLIWDQTGGLQPDIYMKTSVNDGATWSSQTQITDDSYRNAFPSVLIDSQDRIHLVFGEYEHPGWQLKYQYSDDEGSSWSERTQITRFRGHNYVPRLVEISGSPWLTFFSNRSGNSDVFGGIVDQMQDLNPPPYVNYTAHAPLGPDPDDIISFFGEAYDEVGISMVELVYSMNGTPQSDLVMYDDGTNGDENAGDNLYTVQIGSYPLATNFEYQIRATDIDGNIYTSPQYPRYFEVMDFFIKQNEILLVADDQSDRYLGYYTGALDANGYAYDVWQGWVRGEINSTALQEYSGGVVIWYCGLTYPTLSENERNALSSFLDGGGKLFITEQDIGYDLNENQSLTQWYQDYLHATYIQDNIDIRNLQGVPGDIITNGLAFAIEGGDGANNQDWPDEIDPIPPAVTILTYNSDSVTFSQNKSINNQDYDNLELGLKQRNRGGKPAFGIEQTTSSGSGGIRVDDGTHKLVYLSFGFEGIADQPDRTQLMDNILQWLNSPPATTVQVTFRLNTATVPDTIGSHAAVQVRGNTAPLAWDNSTGGVMTNVGGDYWEVTLALPQNTSDIEYKFFANATGDGSGNGWEADLDNPGTPNRQLTTFTSDTSLSRQFFNTTSANPDPLFTPYVPTDSFDVYFRVNMQAYSAFDSSTQALMVKGAAWPGAWGDFTWDSDSTLGVLFKETQTIGGQFDYPVEYFYSGRLRIPSDSIAVGDTIPYKFVIVPKGILTPVTTWESIKNREFVVPSGKTDTTIHWSWWNDAEPGQYTSQDVTVRFSINMENALDFYNNNPFENIQSVWLNGNFLPPGVGGWAGWNLADTVDFIRLYDDGSTNGDAIAGDSIWTGELLFGAGSLKIQSEYKYGCYADGVDTLNGGINPLDNEAASGVNHIFHIDDSDPLQILPTDLWTTRVLDTVLIYDLQYVADPDSDDVSPYFGNTVVVKGMVMNYPTDLWVGARWATYVIDPDSFPKPWSGFFIIQSDTSQSQTQFNMVEPGDIAYFTGVVTEYFGLTEFQIYGDNYYPDPVTPVNIISSGNPLPDPVVLTTSDLETPASAEQWESMWVRIENAEVVNNNIPGFWASITDASGATGYMAEYFNWFRDRLLDASYSWPSSGTKLNVNGFTRDENGDPGRVYSVNPRDTLDLEITNVDFSATISVSDNCANSIDLIFGTASDATDGYDSQYDQYAPLPPPAGAFDARFRAGLEDFYKDFRATNNGTIIWNILCQPESGCEPITLTWNSSELPSDDMFWLVDHFTGGTLVNVDMSTSDSYTDDSGIGQFDIVHTIVDFSATISVSDDCANSIDLVFGTASDATDGYDSQYDQYAPPSAPSGAFDARFIGLDHFIKDYRATNTYSIIWYIQCQPAAGCEPITLTWNSNELPSGDMFWLVDHFTKGGMVSIDMSTTNSYTDDSGFGQFDIVHTIITAFDQDMAGGWNMVGLPSNVVDKYYLSIYPNGYPNTLFGFSGSYYLEDSLQLGEGYWIKFPGAEMVQIEGYPVNNLTIDLVEGWNMIGAISCDIALTDVLDPSAIIITGTLFGFDGAYFSADSMEQGTGYWIRASQSGQIFLACGTGTGASQEIAKQFDKKLDLNQLPVLQFNDAFGANQALYLNAIVENEKAKISYSMPPLPPSGAFDVRFSGDYRICTDEEAIIQVQSSNYPLTINASNISAEKGFQYVIKEILGGEEGKTYILNEGTSIEIINPEVKTLKLSKEKIVPLTFMVQQNYPNPFNPETVIKYGIPNNEKVEVVICNVLGQKVKTLVSKNQEAGFYEVKWDATNDYGNNVGSGIYFYRVKAGKHVAIKKMVLLR